MKEILYTAKKKISFAKRESIYGDTTRYSLKNAHHAMR